MPQRPVAHAQAVPYACFHASRTEKERFVAQKPLEARLRALGLSTLVIFGDRDQVYVIPDAGHSPLLETPLRTPSAAVDTAARWLLLSLNASAGDRRGVARTAAAFA
jgi:hypothetical protein